MAKTRYAVFYNPLLGRVTVMDTVKKRKDNMRKKLFDWASVVEPIAKEKGVKRCMITLTYAPDKHWDANHIRAFMHSLKRRKSLDLLAYAWVIELQERKVPHYHIILLYRGTVPYPDKSGLWKYGMSNILFKLRTMYYICKYVGKEYQKNFFDLPQGARVFAVYIKDKSLKEKFDVLQFSDVQQRLYNQGGLQAVKDNKPVKFDELKSQYIGSSVTKEYAQFLADEFPLDKK